MDIDFPENFQQELSGKLNVAPADVFDTFVSPEKTDEITMGDLTLHFALRQIPQVPTPYYLLTYGRLEGERLQVKMAWKLAPDLHPDMDRVSPLNLLETFAREYGLAMTLGDHTSPFWAEESFSLSRDDWERGVQIATPLEHQYVQQTFLKVHADEHGLRVDCALAYCIDIDRYREWTGSKG